MAAARKLRVFAPQIPADSPPAPPPPPPTPPPAVDEERQLDFARVPLAILHDHRLTPAERLVAAEVMAHLVGHAPCVVARDARMAEALGLTRPTVNRALAKLERLGWILREEDFKRAAMRRIRLRFRLLRGKGGSDPTRTTPVIERAQGCDPGGTAMSAPAHKPVRAGSQQLQTPDPDPGARGPAGSVSERPEPTSPAPQASAPAAEGESDPVAIAEALEGIKAKLNKTNAKRAALGLAPKPRRPGP